MANKFDKTNPTNTGLSSSDDFDFSIEDDSTASHDSSPNNEEIISNVELNSTSNKQSLQPQIPGDSAPFIVLCGPPTSGKSMVLKSLATYLYQTEELGYSIAANTTLLNSALYQEHCRIFDSIIGDPNSPMPNTVNYLMADIMDKNGNVAAHFLEAPGEDFFSLSNSSQEPNIQFKGYLEKVAQISPGKSRKVIYIILLDLDSATSFRNDSNLRGKYEKKMEKLYNRFVLHHPSRVILLYNKVDLPKKGLWANTNGCSNPKAVLEDAKLNYPHLFFKKNFLFWEIDDFKFLPFCTGSYPEDGSYTASGPAYPSALWKEITSTLW